MQEWGKTVHTKHDWHYGITLLSLSTRLSRRTLRNAEYLFFQNTIHI